MSVQKVSGRPLPVMKYLDDVQTIIGIVKRVKLKRIVKTFLIANIRLKL